MVIGIVCYLNHVTQLPCNYCDGYLAYIPVDTFCPIRKGGRFWLV